MKIEITVTSPDLANAINNLADAMRGNVVPFATFEQEIGRSERKQEAPVKAATPAPEKEAPEETETPPKTAKERKEEIAAEIVALGYEPPTSGTVAKYEEALEAAKGAAKETANVEPKEEETEVEQDEEEEETEKTVEITHDSVRAFAGAMVKNNPEMGRTKLGAILKKVNAESITLATEKQLEQMVPMLETAAGKKFGE